MNIEIIARRVEGNKTTYIIKDKGRTRHLVKSCHSWGVSCYEFLPYDMELQGESIDKLVKEIEEKWEKKQ